MSASRIANRYAKALMDLSVEEGVLEGVLSDLKYVGELAKEEDFKNLINSPIIDKQKKKSALTAIFESKVQPLTLRFLTWVTDRGREEAIPEMLRAFEELYKEDKKITTVNITSAVALDERAINKIIAHLKETIIEERQFEIKTKVDPSILGGFILRYGDNLYDASLKTTLTEMRKALMDN